MQMIKKTLTALALATAISTSAFAAGLPTATSDIDIIDEGYVGDYELDSYMPDFVAAGFKEVAFKSYGDAVEGLKKDLLCPDYEARSGKKTDCNALIEVGQVSITGGFFDLVTISHLEGDCSENGCRADVWRMMAGTWVRMLTFTNSGGIALKTDPETKRTLLVAVGLVDQEKAAVQAWLWDGNEFKLKEEGQ